MRKPHFSPSKLLILSFKRNKEQRNWQAPLYHTEIHNTAHTDFLSHQTTGPADLAKLPTRHIDGCRASVSAPLCLPSEPMVLASATQRTSFARHAWHGMRSASHQTVPPKKRGLNRRPIRSWGCPQWHVPDS